MAFLWPGCGFIFVVSPMIQRRNVFGSLFVKGEGLGRLPGSSMESISISLMSNNNLLLRLYNMGEWQACLVLKCNRSKLCKIPGLLQPLHFAAVMKQLSMAIDTGAEQQMCYALQTVDGRERVLKMHFCKDVVLLQYVAGQVQKLVWTGSPREFRMAVDGMLARLPCFY